MPAELEKESNELYIGLMCGTSIDGVDVALVDFSDGQYQLVGRYLHPIADSIRNSLSKLCDLRTPKNLAEDYHHRVELLGELDHRMGEVFAESVNEFLTQAGIQASSVHAIGSHGQTIRHQPSTNAPFTLQIGDPNIIASQTGITTVADFRRMDMANGGQGAPLAPAFHKASMQSDKENRIILNLGGIANITVLPSAPDTSILGFDTGTANTLLDAHFKRSNANADRYYDHNSEFALQGNANQVLFEKLMQDPYFQLPPPKSTGREYFSLNWLDQQIESINLSINEKDIQATLVDFSAATVANAIHDLKLKSFNVFASGGGMHNQHLLNRISHFLGQEVSTTNELGVDGDYLEAMTFAWLARQRVLREPGNLPSVTGAKKHCVLGAVYLP